MDDVTTKRCARCGETKPATEAYFSRYKNTSDGLQGYCKACVSAYNAARYVPHPRIPKPPAPKPPPKPRRQRMPEEEQKRRDAARCHAWYLKNADEQRKKAKERWHAKHPPKSPREKKPAPPPDPKVVLGKEAAARGARICTACGTEYPATVEYFHRKGNGLNAKCKACNTAQADAYRRAHPEKRETTNAKGKVLSAHWRREHPDRKSAATRKWAAKNPAKIRVNSHKRRTRADGLPHVYSNADWQHALDYFNGCCAVCGRQGNDLFGTHILAMDHWIPLSSPDCPGTVPSNIVPLCHGVDGCNNRKHDKDAREWLTEQFGQRKANQIADRIEDYLKSQEKS